MNIAKERPGQVERACQPFKQGIMPAQFLSGIDEREALVGMFL